MCVCAIHVQLSSEAKRKFLIPGALVTDRAEPSYASWELNPGPVQAHQVYSTLSHMLHI